MKNLKLVLTFSVLLILTNINAQVKCNSCSDDNKLNSGINEPWGIGGGELIASPKANKDYLFYAEYYPTEPFCTSYGNKSYWDVWKNKIEPEIISAIKQHHLFKKAVEEGFDDGFVYELDGLVGGIVHKNFLKGRITERTVVVKLDIDIRQYIADFKSCSSFQDNNSNDKSNTSNTEATYRNKQSKTEEKISREKLAYEKRKKEQEAYLNEVKRKGEQKLKAIDNIENSWNNVYNEYSDQQRKKTAKELDEFYKNQRKYKEEQRLKKIERERYFKEKEAKKKKEEEEKTEKERISNSRDEFYKTLMNNDTDIPFEAQENELFFILAATKRLERGSHILFVPFSLSKNEQNKLPLKTNVFEDFKNKTNYVYGIPVLCGPFKSIQEQQRTLENLKIKAKKAKITILEDIDYSFD